MKYKINIIFLNIWEEQNATTFCDKTKQNIQQTKNTEELPQPDKGLIYEKPPDSILNGGRLDASCLRSEIREGSLPLPLPFKILQEGLAKAIRQEKEIKYIQFGKEEVNLCLWMI